MAPILIFTLQGKREHIGIHVPEVGWLPLCGQARNDAWFTRRRITTAPGRTRTACAKCSHTAVGIFVLTAGHKYAVAKS